MRLLNERRASEGLPLMAVDNNMTTAAEHRAAQASIYYEHETPTDGNIWDLPVMGENNGGEVLAYIYTGGDPTPEEVARQLFGGWMGLWIRRSPKSRER